MTAVALIHVRRAALLVAAVIVAGWLAVGALVAPQVVTADTAGSMGMACAVGLILHVSRVRTVKRLDEAHQHIAAMALTDELTGLGNRRALMTWGPGSIAAAHRAGRDVTLLFLDVDGLKQVNDSQGHVAGDKLIADAADVIRGVFRRAGGRTSSHAPAATSSPSSCSAAGPSRRTSCVAG